MNAEADAVSATRSFPANRHSVTAARRLASHMLGDSPNEVREAVELMISELTTNCVRHGKASFELTISIDHAEKQIRVEVSDPGGGTPTMRSPGPDEPTGRGLRIVDMLSDEWGVRPKSPAGKTVWFRLEVSRGG